MCSMAAPVSFPEKELRFTRSAQAVIFWMLSAVFLATAVTLLASAVFRSINPLLPHPMWALLPLILFWILARLAIRLTRHAYVILTPLGVEIFPFFRPAAGMQMVGWQEIHSAEVNARQTVLTLHYNGAKNAGLHLSLRPICADRRSLLAKAVLGRLSPPACQG